MKSKLSFFMLLIFCVHVSWSQPRTVSGRDISDSTKQPLSGVTVSIKGSKSGTSANSEGQYSFTIPNQGNIVLVYSLQTFANAFAMGFTTGRSELLPVQQTQRDVV